ncbi:MAG: hypothetical protein LC772_06660 [Chloroflexi bacterium]|nr:hypothetical protein [Chloroflexota bacterium]
MHFDWSLLVPFLTFFAGGAHMYLARKVGVPKTALGQAALAFGEAAAPAVLGRIEHYVTVKAGPTAPAVNSAIDTIVGGTGMQAGPAGVQPETVTTTTTTSPATPGPDPASLTPIHPAHPVRGTMVDGVFVPDSSAVGTGL